MPSVARVSHGHEHPAQFVSPGLDANFSRPLLENAQCLDGVH